MVHKALQHWRFPDDPLLDQMLRTQAQMGGLLDERLIQQAIQEAEALLQALPDASTLHRNQYCPGTAS